METFFHQQMTSPQSVCSISANKVCVRLIIGGQDGSVTFLVVAHNSLDQRESTRNALRKLPSRKWQKRHHQGSLEETDDKASDDQSSSHLLSRELEERRLYKQRVLRRFRWVKRDHWGLKKRRQCVRSDCIQASFANTFSWTHAINCENCNAESQKRI